MAEPEGFDEVTEQRRRLEEAQALARVGSWEIDLRTGETTWSAQLHRIFGTDPETLVTGPETYLDYVHPDDRAALDAESGALFGDAGSIVSRYRVVRGDDGGICHVEVQVRLVRDDSGQPIFIRGTAMDVTENHRFEQERLSALRELALAKAKVEEREQLLEEAQSLAGIGSWSIDVQTNQVTWSRQMHRIFGTDPDTTEVHFELPFRFFNAEEAARARQFIQEAIESQRSSSIEQHMTRADGEKRITLGLARAEVDAEGQLVRIFGTNQDVTEARRLEQERTAAADALARANEELARQSVALAEAQRLAGVGSWSLDVGPGKVEWSAQMRRLCGDDELTGPGLTLEESWTGFIRTMPNGWPPRRRPVWPPARPTCWSSVIGCPRARTGSS